MLLDSGFWILDSGSWILAPVFSRGSSISANTDTLRQIERVNINGKADRGWTVLLQILHLRQRLIHRPLHEQVPAVATRHPWNGGGSWPQQAIG